jgi:SNF2 family DNA or RNA helicase
MVPFLHQKEAAQFLADRDAALLADDPRVGKTGSALLACQNINANTVLIVTTASARPNWAQECKNWKLPLKTKVFYSQNDLLVDETVAIVSWANVCNEKILNQLQTRRWDVMILDESHYAKSIDAKRTTVVYKTLVPFCKRVWALSGTPITHSPADLYPMLSAIAKDRLAGNKLKNLPDISTYPKFLEEHCVIKQKYFGGRNVMSIVGGKNLTTLKERLAGFMLRRTQQDVGITKPIYSSFLLHPSKAELTAIKNELSDLNPKMLAIIAAFTLGEEKPHKENLARIRRVVGILKAKLTASVVEEELEDGLPNIVLMAWHQDVIKLLAEKLHKYGVSVVTGETPTLQRQNRIHLFNVGRNRVFIGQISAAGEAIDLSVSSDLMFVELSFSPKDMYQAALRITNHNQKKQPYIRVCALEGSIDFVISKIVTRKVECIKEVMGNED